MCQLTEASLHNPRASRLFCLGSSLRWSVLSYLGNVLSDVKYKYRSHSEMKLPRWLSNG